MYTQEIAGPYAHWQKRVDVVIRGDLLLTMRLLTP
jgi:hypothetical protein